MFHAYCHSSNFLAFLKDSGPDYESLLAQLRGAVKDRNFLPERLSEPTPDRAADGHPATVDEIATLRGTPFGRDAQEVMILTRLQQRHLTYRPKGKGNCPWVFFSASYTSPPTAGCLLQLYRFKCGEGLRTAALVQSHAELTDEEAKKGDFYRRWEALAGRLYNVDAMPPAVIPADAIMHHAIHREYFSKELNKAVRHLMPLSKVSNAIKIC